MNAFFDFLQTCSVRSGTRTALSMYAPSENRWKTLSYSQLFKEAQEAAVRLQAAGLQRGDRVALLADSSLEWITAFFGVAFSGGVIVPLDGKLTGDELAAQLALIEPSLILYSERSKAVARDLRLKGARVIKALSIDRESDRAPINSESDRAPINSESDRAPINSESDRAPIGAPFIPTALSAEETAVICFTSGTGGSPAGVMISARAILFEADAVLSASDCVDADDVVLSILPLNHLYGLSSGVVYSLRCGHEFCLAHELSLAGLVQCIRDRRVTQLLAIPLFVQLLMRGILSKAGDPAHPIRAAFFRWALAWMKRFYFPPIQALVFGPIRRQLGGSLKRMVCGGAELDAEVFDFFKAIGIPVYPGYGLTETGPVIAVNTQRASRRGTVGRPIPGVEVKLVEGEIWTRGPHLMTGYFRNPELTAAVLTPDGWFKTGDLGSIDADGYLSILGRKKSLIVLSSGKKVQPEEIEAVLGRIPRIKQICVLGLPSPTGQGERVVAVVIPSEDLEAEIRAELKAQCLKLAEFKRPHEIIFRKEPFPMTASQKVKRKQLAQEMQKS